MSLSASANRFDRAIQKRAAEIRETEGETAALEHQAKAYVTMTGAQAGALAGAAIGSVVPVVGTTIGAILGAIGGALAGHNVVKKAIG